MNCVNLRMSGRRRLADRFKLKPLVASMMLALGASNALALPQGGVVAAGTASINTSGPAMTIQQSSNSATYNWQSFNIAQPESVRVNQPSAASVSFHYVLGNTNSQIDGTFSSNGQLFLSNPNGIVFGATAQVNAAGLTLEAGAGHLLNAGHINVGGGNLIANAGLINNTGLIEATSATAVGGRIVLSATSAISNTGSIDASGASGGSILLNAGSSVLQQGSVLANGSPGAGGSIALNAGYRILQNSTAITRANGSNGGNISYRTDTVNADAGLMLSGTIETNGSSGNGGSIVLTGTNVELLATRITATGSRAGGNINIGGGFQGRDTTIANAKNVSINTATRIDASGAQGNGGNVVVWSDQQTIFSGDIKAKGGATATRGGQVEVSGHNLGFNGMVDASTTNGLTGSLLLDPINITIQTSSGPRSQFFLGRNGSLTELTNGNLVINDTTDGTATVGAGTVWLFNGTNGALISTLTGSVGNDLIGADGITALSNGNFVVSSSTWHNGTVLAAGAVTWVNGTTGLSGMVSSTNSLVGNATRDFVGFGGVTALSNGNYVVNSYNWGNQRGAVTWGNGATGIVGSISSANSLVGDVGAACGLSGLAWPCTMGDQVGSGGIRELFNGNYVVGSNNWRSDGTGGNAKGAVTWANGQIGVRGVLSSANSLVGSTIGDNLGSFTNGVRDDFVEVGQDHYLIISPAWGGNRGAVTWANGNTGITGVISSANSLVGSTAGTFLAGDRVGQEVIVLGNRNYLVMTQFWNGRSGAVTWGNGNTGITGVVSSANSLVGSSANDLIGSGRIAILSNGNFVVSSPSWGGGKGALTWGSGTAGVRGQVSALNSLVGSTPDTLDPLLGVMSGGDHVGYGQIGSISAALITPLSNGNYVAASPNWNGGMGAATWGNGVTGLTGVVSSSNSLVGNTTTDHVGSGGVTALSNGNYVVNSGNWNAARGATTWGNGNTGIVGWISSANSLTGGAAGDGVGYATALSNGNYVVNSGFGGLGAVTLGNGATGTRGIVSASNSLVGNLAGDGVGNNGIYLVGNGNFIVSSGNWHSGRGAVTWVNGSTGLVGTVSEVNSLVGGAAGDFIGRAYGGNLMTNGGVQVLDNGNYVVRSFYWNGNKGAVSWGDGNSGVTGIVSAANSLVGSVAGDYVGSGAVTSLPSGNYVVTSPYWNNGTGAITWGSASAGAKGVVSATNSLIGVPASVIIQESDNIYLLGSMGFWNNNNWSWAGNLIWANGSNGLTGSVSSYTSLNGGVVKLSNNRFAVSGASGWTLVDGGSLQANLMPYSTASGQSYTIDPTSITNITNTGTAVTLQASNDITVNSAIFTAPNPGVSKGGNLTLQAGRSVLINANINTAGGNLNLIANDLPTNGVVLADRLAGAATIRQGTGASINTGTGSLNMEMRNGTTSGAVTLGNISTGGLNVLSSGAINQSAGSLLTVNGSSTLNAGTNAITLTNATNNFKGAVIATSAAQTQLTDVSALTVLLNGTGTATLRAGGALTVLGGTAGGLTAVTPGVLKHATFSSTNLFGSWDAIRTSLSTPGSVLSLIGSAPPTPLNNINQGNVAGSMTVAPNASTFSNNLNVGSATNIAASLIVTGSAAGNGASCSSAICVP